MSGRKLQGLSASNTAESSVKRRHCLLQVIISAALALRISISACAGLPSSDGTRWNEEVLLHDGSKILVERSQSYGGRHESGQTPPIKEQSITFRVPGSKETISWKSEYSDDIGRANFLLVALHILHDVPYIVAVPNLCQSYNKWGRPNPPYVLFKYEGKEWRRLSLSELPTEFKDINLIVNSKGEEETIAVQSVVTAELVKNLNSELDQPEYKSILRTPLLGKKCPQSSSSPRAPKPRKSRTPSQ